MAFKALVKALPEPKAWHLMADRSGFHRPSTSQQARAKLMNNASVFQVNYAYLVAASALTGLLFNFGAFCAVVAAGVAAAALLLDTRFVGATVLKDITMSQRQMGAGSLCLGTLLLSGAVGAAATGGCIGTLACAAHGVYYEPAPDFS